MTKRRFMIAILLGIAFFVLLIGIVFVCFIGEYNEEGEKQRQPVDEPESYEGYAYIEEVYDDFREDIKIYGIEGTNDAYSYKFEFDQNLTAEEKRQIILQFHNVLLNHIESNDTALTIEFYNDYFTQSQPYDVLLSTQNISSGEYLSMFIDSNIFPAEDLSDFVGIQYLCINYYYISDNLEGFADAISDTAIRKLVISRMESYVDKKQLADTQNMVRTIIKAELPDIKIEMP